MVEQELIQEVRFYRFCRTALAKIRKLREELLEQKLQDAERKYREGLVKKPVKVEILKNTETRRYDANAKRRALEQKMKEQAVIEVTSDAEVLDEVVNKASGDYYETFVKTQDSCVMIGEEGCYTDQEIDGCTVVPKQHMHISYRYQGPNL